MKGFETATANTLNNGMLAIPLVGARIENFMGDEVGAIITLDNGMLLEIKGNWSIERSCPIPAPGSAMDLESAEILIRAINSVIKSFPGLTVTIAGKTARLNWSASGDYSSWLRGLLMRHGFHVDEVVR